MESDSSEVVPPASLTEAEPTEAAGAESIVAITPAPAGSNGKAIAFGVLVAIVSSLLYSVVHIVVSTILNLREATGLVGVAVGLVIVKLMGPVAAFLIGRSMLFGSGNRGGRALSIAAALLTYIAIAMAEVPLLAWQLFGQGVTKFSAGIIFDFIQYGLESPAIAMNDLTSGTISLLFLIGSMIFAWRVAAGSSRVKPARAQSASIPGARNLM